MALGFTVAGESELEDFWGSVKRHGFKASDFHISETSDPMTGTGVQAVTGTVTIRCGTSGIERTYQAGYGTSWPAQVDQDLGRGVFGKRAV